MRAGALVAAAVLLAGLGGCASTPAAGSPGPSPAPTRSPIKDPAAEHYRSARTYDVVALPVRLRIPAAGVDTPLEKLGRMADGTIALPTRPELAGWFAGGPRPGQPGPAVIIGHVDWNHSAAVFFRLVELGPGDAVYVDRADGSTQRFRVVQRQQVPKIDFPTDQVYAPDLAPSLRLITCGGSFDHRAHSYRDNVIVYAAPA